MNDTSATNEFFAKCPALIIGVTGTKGKSTTSALIVGILRAAGRTVHSIEGDEGLGKLPNIQADDIVVYELNSLQLYGVKYSPRIAVITHIEPERLDAHKDMEEYLLALAAIRRHQAIDDLCFFQPDNVYVQQIIDMPPSYELDSYGQRDWRWRAFQYGVRNIRDANVGVAYIERDIFCIQRPGQEELSTMHTSILKIEGRHNQLNACAAISVALAFGVDDKAIEVGLSAFTGLPHCLELVREVNGVSYYDDSYATTPGSAIVAMKTYSQPKVMIIGGADAGIEFGEFASVAQDTGVRCVMIMGDEGASIEAELNRRSILAFTIGAHVSMAEVVAMAGERAKPGDAVILSPAYAGLGVFTSYADRGNKFADAVKAL